MGFVTLVGAGGHILSLFHQKQPYLKLSEDELKKFLPDESRREWWQAHNAWCALDHMTAGKDLELAYCVSTKLVAEMVDANCCGVYIPGKRIFVPSGTSLYEDLRLLSRSRDLAAPKI